jgi:hypothetical protein
VLAEQPGSSESEKLRVLREEFVATVEGESDVHRSPLGLHLREHLLRHRGAGLGLGRHRLGEALRGKRLRLGDDVGVVGVERRLLLGETVDDRRRRVVERDDLRLARARLWAGSPR